MGLTLGITSLLILVLPLASATQAGPRLVTSAPFKGTSSPTNAKFQTGCGSLGVLAPARFVLPSGVGGFVAKGKSTTCPASQFWVGTSSSNQASGEFTVAIPFHVPVKSTHIAASLQASWSATVTASDAGKPLCTQGSTYENNQYYAAWNYTKTTSGSYYANDNGSYSDRSTQPWFTTWSNGTSGNSPMLHPWKFKNTTFFQWFHSWGGSASCYAQAMVSGFYSDYLVDETTGAYITQTGNTFAGTTNRQFFDMSVDIYNSTSWNCYNSTQWDGPSTTWSNGTLSCNSGNSTVTSISTVYVPTYTSTSGHNNSATLTSTGSVAGQWYWNSTFVRTHHYELFFDVQMLGSSQDGWTAPGAASFLVNMGGASNGFKLVSITAT